MKRSSRPAKKNQRCCEPPSSPGVETPAQPTGILPARQQAATGHLASQVPLQSTVPARPQACQHAPTATCTTACLNPYNAVTSQPTAPPMAVPLQPNHAVPPVSTDPFPETQMPQYSTTSLPIPRAVPNEAATTSLHTPTVQVAPPMTTEESSSGSDSSDEEDMSFQSVVRHHSDSLLNNGMSCYQEPISTPISTQIDRPIRRKIWAHKYIDLATLLPNNIPQSGSYTLQMDGNAQLSIVPTRTKKILSIEQWTTAFLRFVAVYAERYPLETPALMKYGEIVRDIAVRRPGPAFLQYDRQFRSLRSSVLFPWDRIHTEFWLMASTSPSFRSQSPRPFRGTMPYRRRQPRPNPNRFLDNTCWVFNRRGECSTIQCPHPHVCGLCRGNHSATRCTLTPRQNVSSTNTPRPSGHKPPPK